jgi:hypothetical protein
MSALAYQKYEEYSTLYIVNLDRLNGLSEQEINQWIVDHCYYILNSQLDDDFKTKLAHNLTIARQNNDLPYIEHLRRKLKIDIDPIIWEYHPTKIKIKIKPKLSLNGCNITPQLAQVLGVPQDSTYKYHSAVIRLVHKYIHEHQLQNQYDLKTVTPDQTLQTVLSPLNQGEIGYTYLNLPSHLKDHLL